MKVVLVSPHFPPDHIGGVEQYVKRLADDLRARGDEPEVICVEDVERANHGLEVIRDTRQPYAVHRIHLSRDILAEPISSMYDVPGVESAIGAILDASAADVMHLHSGYLLGAAALEAARQRGLPTVVTLHDFWFICPMITMSHPGGRLCTGPENVTKCGWCLATQKRRYRYLDKVTRFRISRLATAVGRAAATQPLALKFPRVQFLDRRRRTLTDALIHADVILSPSRFVRDRVAETGIPPERIAISRYGVDVRRVVRSERPSNSPLRVGYLGQLAPHKGVHVLIEAVRQVSGSGLTLQVFGDPRPYPRYVAQLHARARRDPRIEFRGAYQHAAVYDILSALDVIVVPSVWYENSPFVIQEAQSAHVPVVASRLGGMRELVIDEQDGLLFEPGDATDLARQLGRLTQTPDLLGRLRPDGTTVRPADDEMKELSQHYRRLTSDRKKSPNQSTLV